MALGLQGFGFRATKAWGGGYYCLSGLPTRRAWGLESNVQGFQRSGTCWLLSLGAYVADRWSSLSQKLRQHFAPRREEGTRLRALRTALGEL